MRTADVTTLLLWDDARARCFEPFALTRPVGELRAGTELLRARWERAAGVTAAGFLGAPHLHDFEEPGAPAAVDGVLPAGAIVANARCAVALDTRLAGDADLWRCDGRVAAVRLARPVAVHALPGDEDGLLAAAGLTAESHAQPIRGRWIDEVWHLVRDLAEQLAEDIAVLGPSLSCALPDGLTVLGAHPVYVEVGATVEPLVVMDASAGPVLVRRGATISAFSRIVGPLFVDSGSTVGGGRVACSSIGPVCRVHGELNTAVFVGHSNKAHEGFVGHSIVGRWTNMGAGTITSNLKHTYGSVALWTPAGIRDTGMQFLGTLFGDHVKTGIGVRLTTGTVLGAGANVYGSTMPPKVVPPFAWGDGVPYATYDLARFVQAVERMMARRQMVLGACGRRQLEAAHAARWAAE